MTDLASVRALAERETLAPPAEYQRAILRVLLALLDAPRHEKPETRKR